MEVEFDLRHRCQSRAVRHLTIMADGHLQHRLVHYAARCAELPIRTGAAMSTQPV
jgi:hypothetical protein